MDQTSTQHINAAEISTDSRNISIDVLRGIAILGILIMNIPDFGMSQYYKDYSPVRDLPGSANFYTWFWGSVFVNGKMRGIFTLLFGAGILLFMEKENSARPDLPRADAYSRRMLWLLFFGLVDSYLILWTGDILYEYALVGLFLFPFRRMKPLGLVIIFLLVLTATCFFSAQGFNRSKEKRANYLQTEVLLKQGKKLSDEQKNQRKEWENVVASSYPFSDTVKQEIKQGADEQIQAARSDYGTVFVAVAALSTESHTTGFFYDCWESIGAILLGMALFKLGIFSGKLSKKTYWLLALLGLGIGLPLSYWTTLARIISGNNITYYMDHRWMSNGPFEHIARVFVMLGYVGFFMLLGVYGWLKGFQNVMAKVGRMAFTNYLMQSLICTFIFFGYGFGLYGKLQRYELLYVVLGVWTIQIIFSVLWLKFFKMGPLEWAWRSLIYWKRIPIK